MFNSLVIIMQKYYLNIDRTYYVRKYKEYGERD